MGETKSGVRGGVLMLPAGAIEDGPSSENTKLTPLDLSSCGYNPPAALFLLKNGDASSIVEITHFSPPFGSWMYCPKDKKEDPEIEEKGTLSFVTTVDPLFCALGLLEHRRSVSGANMFQPLDALMHVEQTHNFTKICSPSQISLICEVKVVGTDSFYRLDDEKVFNWLECKIEYLLRGFTLSREDVIDTIAQYLSEPWDKKFMEKFRNLSGNLVSEKASNEVCKDLNAAQRQAMAAILSDAKKENEAAERDERDAPPAKKQKVTRKPSATKMTTRSSRPVTSYFSKKS